MTPDDPLILREIVRSTLLRDLRALKREIAAYPDDSSLWKTTEGISNSAGNLVLHLAGNLRHFIGSLGVTGYVRDRDAEFSTRDLSRAQLTSEIDATIADVDHSLRKLTAEQLGSFFPLTLRGGRVLTSDFLVHLSVHLAYHLGQIDYHRRILTGDIRAVDAMSIEEMLTREPV